MKICVPDINFNRESKCKRFTVSQREDCHISIAKALGFLNVFYYTSDIAKLLSLK